ncbi:MAG: DUF3223 domain-containing protein, partial [Candidatus Pacebacteria bacterium]|nr:DUF3223 domain-containing protein [Candidatus Paceibacterota bacterium]
MARGNPVQLDNGKEFSTQKDAIAFFKDLLHSEISKITNDRKNYSDIMALYKRHPEFEIKSSNEENVQYFIVKD